MHTFLDSHGNDIRYVSPLTEERVEVHFKKEHEDRGVSPNLNIFVVAFTTCWARLSLYKALELLDERVLYSTRENPTHPSANIWGTSRTNWRETTPS